MNTTTWSTEDQAVAAAITAITTRLMEKGLLGQVQQDMTPGERAAFNAGLDLIWNKA